MNGFDSGISNIRIPNCLPVKIPAVDTPFNHAYSDTQFEIIKKYVIDFQSQLDNEHDVGVMLTNFGSTVLMEVTEIGYEKSVLMVFKGIVDGRKSTLIQHINQLNFLLTSVPKSPELPKRKIGFTANLAGE